MWSCKEHGSEWPLHIAPTTSRHPLVPFLISTYWSLGIVSEVRLLSWIQNTSQTSEELVSGQIIRRDTGFGGVRNDLSAVPLNFYMYTITHAVSLAFTSIRHESSSKLLILCTTIPD